MPLHPQSASFVSMLAEQNPPSWQELGPQAGREAFENLEALFGDKPGLTSVDDYWITGDRLESAEPGQSDPAAIRIRVYRSTQDAAPAIVYFHGGGWVLGSIESHDALCRELAHRTGRAVVSVQYRLSPEAQYPQPLDDCVEATQAVAKFAERLGTTDRICLAGDSAGGNLAAATALRLRDEKAAVNVDSLVLIYPVVQPNFDTDSYTEFANDHGLTRDTMKWFWEQYLPQDADPAYAALLDASFEGLPRTLIQTAEYDVLRDEGRELSEKMKAAGVPVQATEYDGMLHGFVHFRGFFEPASDAIQEIASFLHEATSSSVR